MDALDTLFRRLVLAARAANLLEQPLEVGEVVERLVPYRAARRDGGLETNDDYLHALMQLIAGERELLFADELMQDDLRNELAGSNPDLALLRTYYNAKVRLSTTAVQRVLAGDTDIDLRPPTPMATPVIPPPAPTPTPVVSEPVQKERVADECPYCTQRVPTDRSVRYCPNCGIDLRLRRCAGCSAEIEAGWKYCVTCGRTAA